MEFLGVIEFNNIFLYNLLYGILISTPLIAFIFATVKSGLAKTVFVFWVIVYVTPYFIVKEWSSHDVKIMHLAIPYSYMIVFISIYNILSKCTKRKIIIRREELPRLRNAGRSAILVGLATLTMWLGYFVLYPEHSALVTYLRDSNSGESVRFVFYGAHESIQLLYAFTGRIVIPLLMLIVIITGNVKLFLFALPLSLLVAIQSGERQNLFLLLFAVIVSLFLAREKKFAFAMWSLFMIPAILVLTFMMQGNIADDNISLGSFAQIIFNRVVVDPFYMFSYIYATYDGPLLYGGTNKVLSFLQTDTVGWTAIGILPDAWINYGVVGLLIAPLFYAFLLHLAVIMSGQLINHGMLYACTNLLYAASFISLNYSNMFSLVPMTIYGVCSSIYLYMKFKNRLRGAQCMYG